MLYRPDRSGEGRACLCAAFVGTCVWKRRLFVVCCHARPMQPLVMSWVALHDLERFGCVLAEMRAMVCVILCSSVARQNASVVPVCSARVAMRTKLYDCPGLVLRSTSSVTSGRE